jgi:hypothetical protein
MIPLGVYGPATFPALFSNLNSISLQFHAKHRSLSVLHSGVSDVTMCGISKSTKPAHRMMQSVILTSIACICITSVPSFTLAGGMDSGMDGQVLFQARCYQCHAGKEHVNCNIFQKESCFQYHHSKEITMEDMDIRLLIFV